MLRSRLFWRLFGACAAFTLGSAAVFVAIHSPRQREFVVAQLRQRLHDSAVALRVHVVDEFDREPDPGLSERLAELARENNTRVTLVAADGTVIADSAEDPALMNNHRNRDELVAARRDGYGVSQRPSPTLRGIPMLYYALRLGDADNPRGFLRLALTMESVNDQVVAVQRLAWGSAAAVGLAALAFTSVIVARIIRPLRTLTDAADAIAAGELTQRVPVPGRDELATLAEAFNSMSTELATRIEQLQRNRKELIEHSELLQTVLETMIEGVVAVDSQQHVLFANDAARPLLDIDTPNVVGRPLWEIARHPAIQEVIRDVLQNQLHKRMECELPRTHSVVSLSARRLPGIPCPGVVLVAHDVTELRRLETVRRDFVSNVSHELKTPLASIQAYAETLLGGAIDDAAHNREFLKRIEEQSERLHAIILDLLSLAKIESGQRTYKVQPIRAADVISDCLREHSDLAQSKGVQLVAQTPNGAISVLADKEGLRTILGNLVNNAIKYTPAGGSITVGCQADGDLAKIEVADTGIGIPPEHLDRIFERFYRVEVARSREMGGTGLGLSIVKHLAQLFGGCVEVASEFGKGSTFTVSLPIAEAARAVKS